MRFIFKSVDFELSTLPSIIWGWISPNQLKALIEKDWPSQKKKDSTTRWPLNKNCNINSFLGLQPVSSPYRFWTCQPLHVSSFLKINLSIYREKKREREHSIIYIYRERENRTNKRHIYIHMYISYCAVSVKRPNTGKFPKRNRFGILIKFS